MTRKNDLIFFESGSYSNGYNSFVVVGGGTVRIPTWLLVTTWAVLGSLAIILGFVVAVILPYPEGFSPSDPDGGRFAFLGTAVILTFAVPLLLLALWGATTGLGILIKEWRKAFRGSRV